MISDRIFAHFKFFSKTTQSIFEGLDSEVKARIPGRSVLDCRAKVLRRGYSSCTGRDACSYLNQGGARWNAVAFCYVQVGTFQEKTCLRLVYARAHGILCTSSRTQELVHTDTSICINM